MIDFTFNSLKDLDAKFRGGSFAPNMQVDNKEYKYVGEQPLSSILEMAQNKSKHLAVFEAEDKQQLVLAWGVDNQMCLRPIGAKLTEARDPEIEAQRRQEEEAKKIGVTINVQINGLTGGEPINAKVDTGATTCSLDAQDINVADDFYGGGKLVSFTFRDRQYRTKVANFQSVRTADAGVQNRPTVKFSVTANGKNFTDIEFNLNDRSGMEYDVLIGMNFLEKTDFVIDPQKESIAWDELNKLFETVIVNETIIYEQAHATPEQIQEVTDILTKYPLVTLDDIARRMKTDLLAVVEKLEQ